jgi:hypothetical protein
MVKVTITLPNSALITFESEEPEVIHEIVGMVLRDLPRELMRAAPPANGKGQEHPGKAAGNGAIAPPLDIVPPEQSSSQVHRVPAGVEPGLGKEGAASSKEQPAESKSAPASGEALSPAQQAFVNFCREANPLGDMRRVVVAAEGAARYLGDTSVDAEDLERLFDLAGWPRPHSFVQTLRNAARSKFRWLERVPGRSGHYTVTHLGRATALGG